MSSSSQLQAVGLIEKDIHGDTLWVWSYPTTADGLRELLLRKCTLSHEEEQDEDKRAEFSYGHFSQIWYYLSNFHKAESENLPMVASFCVVIIAKEFNPEKYQHLSSIFGQAYLSSGTPVSIISHYLSAYTKGQVTQPPENCLPFSAKSYDIRKAYVACSFKELVQEFGVESILMYNALLLKKKVAVYAPTLSTVLRVCRTLPLLVWHRQNWNIVYPNLALDDGELKDLASHGSYVAGFIDPAIEGRTELYDLFVNVPAASLTVAPHAKDSFGMTKLHKDIAMYLMQCAGDEEYTDQAVVKELSVKTKELLNNVKSLAPEGEKLTLDLLRERKLTPATETFLFMLATTEGLTQL